MSIIINFGEFKMNGGIRSKSGYMIPIPIQNGTTEI